ncbi:MAG TPA: hypothetical protein VNZ64_03625 [Candidatus Acidoferrum sp.]|jgi:hypothetical protein|nr:hypothetical protein [Candidatus Acidoferrum sp.]
MKSAPILPAQLDWPSAVGSFILNFGTLDHLLFVFLQDHLPPDEFATGKQWHFKDRLSRIAQYLKEAGYPAAKQTAYATLLTFIEPIRALRNHIAHGHLYLRIDPKTQTPALTLFQAKDLDKSLTPDSNHVAFDELLTASETLTRLNEQLQQLCGLNVAACFSGIEEAKPRKS